MATGQFKDTKIRNRLLQVIILLNFDLSGREHLCFWQGFSHWNLLSPRNITSWRKMYPTPRTTLNHAMEQKWLGNWARIAATPVGMGKIGFRFSEMYSCKFLSLNLLQQISNLRTHFREVFPQNESVYKLNLHLWFSMNCKLNSITHLNFWDMHGCLKFLNQHSYTFL